MYLFMISRFWIMAPVRCRTRRISFNPWDQLDENAVFYGFLCTGKPVGRDEYFHRKIPSMGTDEYRHLVLGRVFF